MRLGTATRIHGWALAAVVAAGLLAAAPAGAVPPPASQAAPAQQGAPAVKTFRADRRIGGRLVRLRSHGDPVRSLRAGRGAAGPGLEGLGDLGPVPRSGLPGSWCGERRTTDDTASELGDPAAPRIKVVYAYPSDLPDRLQETAQMIQADVKRATERLMRDSGGARTLRFDLGTVCGPAYLDILSVALPQPRSYYEADPWGRINGHLGGPLGVMAGKHDFLVYPDGIQTSYGGQAELPQSDVPGASNPTNGGGFRALVYHGQHWTDPAHFDYRAMLVLHEVGHNLGAVQRSAPHATRAGHCWDEYDALCYDDGWGSTTEVCPYAGADEVFDCGRDDYFAPAPAAGSYLATHWNTYDSVFLCAPATCLPAGPALTARAPAVQDPAPGGDADGIAEPGETVSLDIPVVNDGTSTASSVTGTLSATAGGSSVPSPSAGYGSLAAGVTSGASPPYRLTVGPGHDCGSALPVMLDLRHAAGRGAARVAVPTGSNVRRDAVGAGGSIPDGDPAGLRRSIDVPDAAALHDLDVRFAVSHDRLSDVRARLEGPGGRVVQLVGSGTSGLPSASGSFGVVFDDEADRSLATAASPYALRYRPAEPLSAFDGGPRAGRWTLVVSDAQAGATGQLVGFYLVLSTCATTGGGGGGGGDGTAPTVKTTIPNSGATNVAATTDVTVTFSEAMDRAATENAFSLKRSGSAAPVAGAFSWAGAAMTFDPAERLVAGTYTATVGTGARDVSGMALATARTWTFKTDIAKPKVSRILPASGATNQPAFSTVAVTFSEPMDPATVPGAVTLREKVSGKPVAATVALDAAGRVATLAPAADLATFTRHTIAVATSAQDLSGNPLALARTQDFTTWKQVAPMPAAASVLEGTAGTGFGTPPLARDDDVTTDVSSTLTGTRAAALEVAFPGVPRTTSALKVHSRMRSTRACSLNLAVWNWPAGAWTSIGSRSLSVEVPFDRAVAAPTSRWVSGSGPTGDLRVRARCTSGSGAFVLSADVLRLSHAP